MEKTSERWQHQTGIAAVIGESGHISLTTTGGKKEFVFMNSKRETVVAVAQAILDLAEKAKPAKHYGKKQN